MISYWSSAAHDPSIDEVFQEWNDRRLELKKISPATHIRNRQYYERHYAEFGKNKIKSVCGEDILDFLEEQIVKYDLTAKSFSNLKGITKGFLKRAKKRQLISYNVEELFADLDVSDSEFKKVIKEDYEEVFDEEEMPKIMEYLESNQDSINLGLLLMFVSGIRVGELAALKNDVICANEIKIRRTETRYFLGDGKYAYEVKEHPKSSAGIRNVVIPQNYEWLCNKIRLLNPFGEYAFINSKGERMTTNSFRRRLERVCKKLNIYPKSPHKIRKTYGTILLDNNIDNRLVIGQMGHTEVMITEKHYHRNRKSLEKKTKILSSIPEFSSCV